MRWYKINDEYSVDLDKVKMAVVEKDMHDADRLTISIDSMNYGLKFPTHTKALEAKADIDSAMSGVALAAPVWRGMPIIKVLSDHLCSCEICDCKLRTMYECDGHYFCDFDCIRKFDGWGK